MGVTQSAQSEDALALALALAESLDASVTVCNVYPLAYDFPSQAHVDAEWRAYLVEEGQLVLRWAREQLGERRNVDYQLHGHRSSGLGLAEFAASRDADMIVIGSAPGGSSGRIAGGSTSDQLLHGSPVPVALAPMGYHQWAPTAIDRVVVAFQANPESAHSLQAAIWTMQRNDVPVVGHLELITVAQQVPRHLRRHKDAASLDGELRRRGSAVLDQGRALVRSYGHLEADTPGTVLEGEDIDRALAQFDWRDADVLVVGSTGSGPIRRVFLGDMTYKLVRSSTVPVLVATRSDAATSAS